MSPRPFVEQEPAELAYCQDCAQHYWRDLGHECRAVKAESDWVVLAVIATVAIALLLLVTGAWHPGWPRS